MGYTEKLGIKSWAEDDRPREKLLIKGRKSLTNAELIAILIRSGSREESAVGLSQQILSTTDNDLHRLGKLEVADFTKFKGIGEAKALSIVAALELGRRRKSTEVKERVRITCSSDTYNLIIADLEDLTLEEFWIILLDRSGRYMSKHCVSTGGVAGTVVDAKPIFKIALNAMASSIILAHNHPSGNLKPSQEDLKITKRLVDGAKLLDMYISDHVIVSEHGYYSFADENLL